MGQGWFAGFACTFALVAARSTCAADASVAPLGATKVALAAPAFASGAPTALAAADLDADGVPDLIVSYASSGGSAIVVYPGDVEAVYPPAGTRRAASASPFRSGRLLGMAPGIVEALLASDVDADGIKDVIAENEPDAAATLFSHPDGDWLATARTIDVETAAATRAAVAPLDVTAVTAAPDAIAPKSIADVVETRTPNNVGAGAYRRSAMAKAALANPAKPPTLAPPDDAFAVLSMRLNRDAIPDLVVLRPGAPGPEIFLSAIVGTTFTVTITKDEKSTCNEKCSLREAIVAANATPEADLIEFAIPTTDPGYQPATGTWRIQPDPEYPVITQTVTIDATTQPGFVGQPVIELDGTKAPDESNGFIINATNVVVRGFVVNNFRAAVEGNSRFCGCGIIIDGGSNCIVEGNYVGTDVTGTQARSMGVNGIGLVQGGNNLIGGTTVQARNVVSGNREGFTFHTGVSTFISSTATNNVIAGNYIGVDRSGFNAIPNSIGILINSANNTIGGTDPGAGNVIAGNAAEMINISQQDVSAAGTKIHRNFIGLNAVGTAAFNEGFSYGVYVGGANSATIGMPGSGNRIAGNDLGIYIPASSRVRSTSGHVIQGNIIGVDALGRPLGNSGPGIRVDNAFNSSIGGTANGEANLIANNQGSGIEIGFYPNVCSGCPGVTQANHNRILSNSVYNNAFGLGINLTLSFSDMVTANDADDSDSGPNDFLNWPVLTSASSTANTSQVNAQALTCGPLCAQGYTLQFFASPACDSPGNGEGHTFLGQISKAADATPVVANLAVPIPNGWFVTATATDSANNTSEFSNCVQALGGPQPTVSPTPTVLPSTTPTSTPLAGQTATRTPTPTVTPTNIPGVEHCGNCRDDDGDTIVDRDDVDCARPRANGNGAGIADATRAKAVVKCQKGLGKAGSAFALKKQKLLQSCLQQVLACVQKPGGDCLTKAGAKCQKVVGSIAKLEGKLTKVATKLCGAPALALGDLTGATGLGFTAETSTCADVQVLALTSVADVALCLGRRHECQVEELVSQEHPRARELLVLAGIDPADFPCVAAGADGGGQGVGDTARAKALIGCAKGLQKAAGAFVKARLGGLQKCLAGITECKQRKPADIACPDKVRAKCAKIVAKIGDAPKGAGDKARRAIAKACAAADPADLGALSGLGETSAASYCAAIGVPALSDAADVAECVVRHHTCRVGQLLDGESPRARELLGIAGVAP